MVDTFILGWGIGIIGTLIAIAWGISYVLSLSSLRGEIKSSLSFIYPYFFGKATKKIRDKKAVSLLISYVLLISFAIIMGVLVYNWMKSYVPGEGLACPEGTSLFIKDAYCDKDTLEFNLTLENNGRFDIAGFYIHATNSSIQTLATIDLSTKLSSGGIRFPGTSIIIPSVVVDDLGPGETTQEIKFRLSEGIYSIEVTPVRYQGKAGKEKYISCGNAKVKQKINCGEIFNPLSLTGLVSWWKFDGNANDEMGINDGTVNGVMWRTGKSGQSAYFDGGGYITVPDDDSLDITGNISIAVWVNATSGGPNAPDTILDKLTGNNGYIWDISKSGGGCGDDILRLGYGSENLCSQIRIQRNQWQYVVITYDKSTVLFYYNSVLNSSLTQSGSTSINSEQLLIGKDLDDAAKYFEGQLDELMIFNRTLSPAEITQLYNYLRA